MARIGKTVQFNGSRETISNTLVQGITKLGLTGINFGFVNDNTMNIYGEAQDLNKLKTEANARGFEFTILGNAPAEPVSSPSTPTPVDEITAQAELRTAFNTIMQEETDALWTRIETEYNNIRTTSEPFFKYTDFKHLRQRG